MTETNDKIQPIIIAGTNPEKFADGYFADKTVLAVTLTLLILLGFGLRAFDLGSESLSEDELNKLQTVAEYRENGLSGKNGEHPFLMKGLQTVSVTIGEKFDVSEEAALRFPTVLFGSLSILLLFFLVKELFGSSIGVISSALYAVDPNAIGFDRIAKEDSFLLFFFLFAGVFFLRSQTVAEKGERNPQPLYYLTAIGFAGMMASKYMPHILAVFGSYYNIFQAIPQTKWRLGKAKWLMFFAVAGVAFLIFNPTILLPETWREMLLFAGEKRIGHDAYEFAGELYRQKLSLWLAGVPPSFYYVFIAVKTPFATLIFFIIGLPLMFKKRLGDGRFFMLFWVFFWFMPFTLMGGKFTRYFTIAQPIIFIVAAVGIYFAAEFLTGKLSKKVNWLQVLLAVAVVSTFAASLSTAPHFRLFTNAIGNGTHNFPHDEFYDLSLREITAEVAKNAGNGATVAIETPYLLTHYANKIGRNDLNSISLSDVEKMKTLKAGDFIVIAEGRRYFSNEVYVQYLKNSCKPISEINVNGTISARIYRVDENMLEQIKMLAK
jgi:hypothetical protein